jgi:hypothetical protein
MGTGQINSIYVLPTNQTFLASTGSYSIRYENNGQPLATYNFEPGRPLEGTTSVFSLLLPYDELTTRIVLLHNGVELTSKTASSNAPSITVNYPNSSEVLSGSSATVQWTATDADADELRYLIQYSSDFGATWQTLTSDWKTTTFELNLNSISGTNQGLVRIFASDGFYTSQDQSNSTFSVNSHAPQVSITTSSNNSYFVGDQSVVLNGNAFDLEDGQLSGSSFIWSSNINGSLGDGQTLSLSALDLSEGHHTITLTARDSSSEIGTANINIQILRNQASIPVTLKTAPGDLSFIAQVGTVNLSDPQILSVRNDGDGTLNWSASTNQSWIQLSETSGIAPSNVEIRINPTGLAIGNYTGTIAITNSEATNTTQVVNVSLSIVETSQSSLDFTVNLTTDEHDANTADSLCDVDLSTTGLQCTLRAAIEQGNALPANDRVLFNLPANSIITLTTTNGGEIVIDNALEIVGTGANNLIINGGTGTNRIFKNLAPLTISGVTLTGGNGTGAAYLSGIGGAIFANGGSLTLDGVHVTGNSVGGYSGGGVYFGGGAHRIINSTFSSNTAYNCGAFVAESSITIINSTISGNNATGGHGGGFCIQGSNTTITSRNVTITNNIGGSNGGGISQSSGTLDFGNTIVAGNSAGSFPEIQFSSGTITSSGNNLIGDSAGDAINTGTAINFQTTDIRDVNPMLGDLQNNGGTTPTRALISGSPAIDKGHSFGTIVDQRGFVRPVDDISIPNTGNGSDIGAFELGPTNSAQAGLQYYPLAYPIRLLDTRSGQPACYAPGEGFTGYETIKTQPAQVTCQGLTIPSSAAAIVGTATVMNTPAQGNLRLYPAGEQLAEVSNVNFAPGKAVSNSFTVKLGIGGAFNMYSYSPSDVIIDVTGYYAPPGTGGLYYHQLPKPIRILETRPEYNCSDCGYDKPGVPLSANSVRLQQAGNISYLGVTIPSSAKAITGNATVVNTVTNAVTGKIKLYPGDMPDSTVTESINYVAGQVVPNAFAVRLDSAGQFKIHTTAATHVLIDVTGYYSTEPAADQNGNAGLLFNILPKPFRLLDTRAGYSACDAPGVRLAAQGIRVQSVRGRTCSNQTVPAEAKAIFGNATVVNNFTGAGAGNIRLYPGEEALANASNLNYVPGETNPNSFIVGLGVSKGEMNIYSYASTDLIIDVSGYFAVPTP